MKDYQLRAWLKVVDVRSIRAAARELGLSQAAVTKAIRELEADLGAPLVTRSSRGIELTACGEQLTVRARLAQAQLGLARQDIAQLQGGVNARVSASVTSLVMLTVLPQVLRDFEQRMPAARVKLQEGLLSAVLPRLRDGSLDFAVVARMNPRSDEAYTFEPVRSISFMVACRRGHPLQSATRWNELLDCPWLLNPVAGSQTTAFLDGLRQAGFSHPTRIIEADSFSVQWNLMARSDALLVCPRGMLAISPYAEEVSCIPVNVPVPEAMIGLLTLRDTPMSLAASKLAALFRIHLQAPNAALI